MITFCRVRPAETVGRAWAATRRREGTTTVELRAPLAQDLVAALAGGLLVVSSDLNTSAAAFLLDAPAAIEAAETGLPGWRITLAERLQRRELVIDALSRTGAAFLRARRSGVAEAADLTDRRGLSVQISVFVDTVAQAVAAVGAGASDLLLRDWASDDIGRLRDALDDELVERSAFGFGLEVAEAREHLGPEVLAAYLNQVDGSGGVRPALDWAPGKDLKAPIPQHRLSAAWTDAAWLSGEGATDLSGVPARIAEPLSKALDGIELDRGEVETLLAARGRHLEAVAGVADVLRERAVGDRVSYVVNRNINYTNQCTYRCGFCAFSKGPRSLNLRDQPYLLETHEIARRAREAWERGATEVCLQGGIHPEFTGDFYVSVVQAIKEVAPDIDIHGFSPLEVCQGAATLGISVRDFLLRLREAGLGSLPGTAAEILDDGIRLHLCPDKIRTAEWTEVMLIAHELGLRSTATIMFGHIDGPASWASHFEVVRSIQRRTGGFTEFVPLPFVHMAAPIYLRGRARPGPTWDEVLAIHSVARIAFDGLIPNVQASWVKLGLEGASALLGAGCNDMGGTLMDESISRAAGAAHGQLMTPDEIEAAVRSAGRVPVQRTTSYEILERSGD